MARRRKNKRRFPDAGSGPPRQDRDLYKLVMARSDINAALRIADYITQQDLDIRDELWMPLHDAAVVAYARPFTANEPFGPLPARWQKFADAAMQKFHDDVLESRHKTIAHSDGDVRRVVVVPVGVSLAPFPVPTSYPAVAVTTRKLAPESFADLALVARDIGTRLHAEIESVLQQLPGGTIRVHPYDLATGEAIDMDSGPDAVILSQGRTPFADPEEIDRG